MPVYCPLNGAPCKPVCIFNVKFKCKKRCFCLIQHAILKYLGYPPNGQEVTYSYASDQ